MIKVAAVTAGGNDPCARFRVRQHIGPLAADGVRVHEYAPLIYKHAQVRGGRLVRVPWNGVKVAACLPPVLGSWNEQIVWLQRELYNSRFTLEGLLKRPIVFDVDDAIWLQDVRAPDAVARIARLSEMVVAGNSFLADWFSRFARQVRIVPTAIDCDRFRPLGAAERDKDEFVLGWTGTHWNLPYLESIEAPIGRFMGLHPEARLLIVADKPPAFRTLPPERVRFVPWSSETEVSAIHQMDVGLMPLPDSDWARGKCSFKMLQYMACGKPVVVSPVGMNAEVLALDAVGIGADTESEWFDAFQFLRADRGLAACYGRSGRCVVEQRFSREAVTPMLRDVFGALS